MTKKLYIVTLLHKVPPEERSVYRANADPDEFEDMHASEQREVGDPAVYAQWLDEPALEAFEQADNVAYVEEAQRTRKVSGEQGEFERTSISQDVIECGVERAVLEFCHFTDAPGFSRVSSVILGVGDTGYAPWPYTETRLEDLWNLSDSPDGRDRDGHGSWCQGAACPQPGKFISGKVLGDNGSGWNSWTMTFVRRFADYCQANLKRGVISLSLGSDGYSRSMEDACRYATERDVLIVAASGNENEREKISSPANCLSVLSVGAMSHHDGSIADFSNRDSDPPEPDIYAPGYLVTGQGGGRWSGTSMATPLVARAAYRGMTTGKQVGEVKLALVGSGRNKPAYEGHGVLAVRGMMKRLAL